MNSVFNIIDEAEVCFEELGTERNEAYGCNITKTTTVYENIHEEDCALIGWGFKNEESSSGNSLLETLSTAEVTKPVFEETTVVTTKEDRGESGFRYSLRLKMNP